MIRQFLRGVNVSLALKEDEDLAPLNAALYPEKRGVDGPPQRITSDEEAQLMHKGTELSRPDYDKLLGYLNMTGRMHQSQYIDIPQFHPFLTRRVKVHAQVYVGKKTYSCERSHEGNSAVQFIHPVTLDRQTGNILDIWTVPIDGVLATFFNVRPHLPLSKTDAKKSPYSKFDERVQTDVFYTTPSKERIIIEHEHLVTHLCTYKRPAKTFGIKKEIIIVTWALNRGRK